MKVERDPHTSHVDVCVCVCVCVRGGEELKREIVRGLFQF